MLFRSGPPSRLHRWTINTAGSHLTFTDEQRSDFDADLPSIDRRHTGRPNRHGWRVETRAADDDVNLGGAIHIDPVSGAETRWDPGPAISTGEWLFVPTGDGEGEGVVMTFSYDRSRDASDLVVLDARNIASGPLARVAIPQRVPYGFHGTWVSASEL